MIDGPGPWGTGPFTLVEGHSSLHTSCAIIRSDPFACTWLVEREERSPRVVLEANRGHWNPERVPRVDRVVFRNDLPPTEALELCLSTEGEVDLITEVDPVDADRIRGSRFAELVAVDANRVLAGIINRGANDAPLADPRARRALNLAVNKDRVIAEALRGFANPLRALTPAWCRGCPADAAPYPHDPESALRLWTDVGWPEGRSLRLATFPAHEGVARLVADDVSGALGLAMEVAVLPDADYNPTMRSLAEKKLPPSWDVLVFGWADLSSEAPPFGVHREFCGADGAFRAGPELPRFDHLYAELERQLGADALAKVAERIDDYVFDEALALFLCAPQALYAVNRHVRFAAYRSTLELAETEVDEEHWSRRSGGKGRSE